MLALIIFNEFKFLWLCSVNLKSRTNAIDMLFVILALPFLQDDVITHQSRIAVPFSNSMCVLRQIHPFIFCLQHTGVEGRFARQNSLKSCPAEICASGYSPQNACGWICSGFSEGMMTGMIPERPPVWNFYVKTEDSCVPLKLGEDFFTHRTGCLEQLCHGKSHARKPTRNFLFKIELDRCVRSII